MTVLVVCHFSRRRPVHAPGRCDILRALTVIERTRAERGGVPYTADTQTALTLTICALPPGPRRDLAVEVSRADDSRGDSAALMDLEAIVQ